MVKEVFRREVTSVNLQRMSFIELFKLREGLKTIVAQAGQTYNVSITNELGGGATESYTATQVQNMEEAYLKVAKLLFGDSAVQIQEKYSLPMISCVLSITTANGVSLQ